MANQPHRFFRTLRDLLIRDLTWEELNKSFGSDARGAYEFYARSMKSVEGERNRVRRALKIAWQVFLAFLEKLTPARRFLYAVALLFFFVAFAQNNATPAVYAFLLINFLLAMELADKLMTKDELSIAREIQLSLQPAGNTDLREYEFCTHSEAARQVGGDYYDVVPLPDASTLLVVGDVSGKGISSALYVVKMQTALQLFATETSDLRQLLVRFNDYIYGKLKKNYFLSLILAKIQPDGALELCRAGHPPALLYRAAENRVDWLKPAGLAVGMAPSSNGNGNGSTGNGKSFENTLESLTLQPASGDTILLFTDGITEAVDRYGKEYGTDRIAALISAHAAEPLENIRRRLVNDFETYRAGADMHDDTTFILLRKK